MMTDMTLTTDEAENIAWGEHIARQEVSQHRWYTKQLVVFESCEFEGRMGFYYLDPATEDQEGQDRFVADPVPIFPVEGREVVTTVWEPKQ